MTVIDIDAEEDGIHSTTKWLYFPKSQVFKIRGSSSKACFCLSFVI